MNLRVIQDQAEQELTNYEGDNMQPYGYEDDGSGFEGDEYTGYNDDAVEFGSDGASFGTEVAGQRVFNTIIKNTGNAPRPVYLNGSLDPTNPNLVLVDGFINYNGAGAQDLQASGAPKTIKFFKDFVNLNPTRVVGMRIQSTDTAFFAGVIKIERKTPFADLGTELVQLGNYIDPKNPNDKIITVPTKDLQYDNQTQVEVTIPAGATVTFSQYIGGIANTAKSLSMKAKRAKRSRKVIMERTAFTVK